MKPLQLSKTNSPNANSGSANTMVPKMSLKVFDQNKDDAFDIDKFFQVISHELKSPVSSALGLISVMESTENLEILKFQLKLLSSKIKDLNFTIAELIDFSMNSNFNMKVEEVDFSNTIDYITEVQINNLNPSFPFEIEKKIIQSSTFYTDKLRLKIILSNLMSNAYKYRDESKNSCKVLFEVEVNHKEAIIRVQDNGIGISDFNQSKVFELFFRVNDQITGNGVGLHITKDAVDKLGGYISIQSIENVGTVFTLTIPNIIN